MCYETGHHRSCSCGEHSCGCGRHSCGCGGHSCGCGGHSDAECKQGHHNASRCNCGGPSHFVRRFCTREERIACLEQYLESLRAEVQAVEEHLAALKTEA